MKNECNIIRDLLPLYVENMASSDTAAFVEEHLSACAECREECDRMREPEASPANTDTVPLVKLKQKMRKKKIQTIICTAILVLALLISTLAVLNAPEYLPYTPELLSVTGYADNSILITFAETVTDYRCELYRTSSGDGRYDYHIEAWSSLWGRWFSDRGERSVTIRPREGGRVMVYYGSNNGSADVCIYSSQAQAEHDSVTTLPRLTLGYYFLLAAFLFIILLVVWFVVKNRAGVRVWVERILFFPVSYMIGHFIILGFHFTTYSMPRDFLLILALSILLYCGFLLAYNIYKLRKEIIEISRR